MTETERDRKGCRENDLMDEDGGDMRVSENASDAGTVGEVYRKIRERKEMGITK